MLAPQYLVGSGYLQSTESREVQTPFIWSKVHADKQCQPGELKSKDIKGMKWIVRPTDRQAIFQPICPEHPAGAGVCRDRHTTAKQENDRKYPAKIA
jgi:hypothetical protein